MKASLISLLCLSAFASAVPAAEHSLIAHIQLDKNTIITPLVFTGRITLGGPLVTLKGTAEAIYAQVLKLNPAYDPTEFGLAALGDNTTTLMAAQIEKRSKSTLLCNVWSEGGKGFGATSVRIVDGIHYLQSLNGGCSVGPRGCSRISCSWNSAIFLCNDRNDHIAPTCSYLASYAADILDRCQYHYGRGLWYVDGQLFDTDNYNICVRRDESC